MQAHVLGSLLFLALLEASPVADTWVVAQDGSGDAATVQGALDLATTAT